MRVRSLLFVFLAVPLTAIAQQSGAADYALGGSSVMWTPGPSSLFLNPAELSRIRQSDFSLNAGRFTRLASFSGSMFLQGAGTFAAGIGVMDSASQYSMGYALPIGNYHSFGVAVSGFRNTREAVSISFGGSLHFPGSVEHSGVHAAASILNLSDNTTSPFFSVNLGAGYWVFHDLLRIQAAFQHTAAKNYALAGAETVIASWLSFQLGTRSFKEIMGGFSISFAHGSIDFGAGKPGAVLSIRASLSTLASDERDRFFELGEEASDEERLTDAAQYYRNAVDYDPYFAPARSAAETIEGTLKARTDNALARAGALLAKKDFLEAMRAYSRILRMDPENDEARENLNTIQPRMRNYIQQLIMTGDSLRNKKEVEGARRSYEQAQELDPENDSIDKRIASLRVLAREGVKSMLTRAKALLERDRLDDAQKAYENVLESEPRNSQARQGLSQIRAKRRDILVENGKTLIDDGNPMEALTIFLDVLKQDSRHKGARTMLDSVRQMLLPEVDDYFRSGLQFYTKDNFKGALEEWEKALLIDPNHQATLEYKKRAEEKLKALEKLK